MALLGDAAVAMWWDMAALDCSEFKDWHSHEHFPERMSIPGFRRGSRWQSAEGGEGFFVMYELQSYDVLTSGGYLAKLNDPTPWSTRMMPKHRNMIRSQCRVAASNGGGVASYMSTLRLSPRHQNERGLCDALTGTLQTLPNRPGITGAHLLVTETPTGPATREQQIRGGDGAADWIILLSGYDLDALRAVTQDDLGPQALENMGAEPGALSADFHLSHALSVIDIDVPSAAGIAPGHTVRAGAATAP